MPDAPPPDTWIKPRLEPRRPSDMEDAVRMLRDRADSGRRAGFEWGKAGPLTRQALYGIASELEHIADLIEAERT